MTHGENEGVTSWYQSFSLRELGYDDNLNLNWGAHKGMRIGELGYY